MKEKTEKTEKTEETKPKKKSDNHYVDNKAFTQAVIDFVTAKDENPDITLRTYKDGDFIGSCIIAINTNLANKHNFRNYTYIDEMVADGVENCIKAISNFKPDGVNAFGFFSMISYNAFVRRIIKEKKNNDKKYRYLSDQKSINEFITKQFNEGIPGSEHENNAQFFVDQVHQMMAENDQLVVINDSSEEKPKRKKADKPETPLSKLIDADNKGE